MGEQGVLVELVVRRRDHRDGFDPELGGESRERYRVGGRLRTAVRQHRERACREAGQCGSAFEK